MSRVNARLITKINVRDKRPMRVIHNDDTTRSTSKGSRHLDDQVLCHGCKSGTKGDPRITIKIFAGSFHRFILLGAFIIMFQVFENSSFLIRCEISLLLSFLKNILLLVHRALRARIAQLDTIVELINRAQCIIFSEIKPRRCDSPFRDFTTVTLTH